MPGQAVTTAQDVATAELAGNQTLPEVVGTGDEQTVPQKVAALPDSTAQAARHAILSRLAKQAAALITRFESLGFIDMPDQKMTDNLYSLELVKKATTAAPVAPLGILTNEEGKRQPVPVSRFQGNTAGTCRAKENVMCGGSVPQFVRTDPQTEANAAACRAQEAQEKLVFAGQWWRRSRELRQLFVVFWRADCAEKA